MNIEYVSFDRVVEELKGRMEPFVYIERNFEGVEYQVYIPETGEFEKEDVFNLKEGLLKTIEILDKELNHEKELVDNFLKEYGHVKISFDSDRDFSTRESTIEYAEKLQKTIDEQAERIKELEEKEEFSDRCIKNGIILNKQIDEQAERIKKLKEIVEYLEYFIEWCECGNPKADCVCEHQNGWHNSKEYKLLAELRKAKKVMKKYIRVPENGTDFPETNHSYDFRQYLSTLPPEIKELLDE